MAKRLPAAGREGREPPTWPLRSDRELERKATIAELAVERLRGQLNETTDRRTVKRLEKDLDAALADGQAAEDQLREQAELETAMWAELWATPQATVWENYGWIREVALYVRCSLRAESGDMRAAAEARQRSDRLGLSPLAMRNLRWEVAPTPEPTAAADVDTTTSTTRKRGKKPLDPRRALRAV